MALTKAQQARRDKMAKDLEDLDAKGAIGENEEDDWDVIIEENGRKITMPYSKAKPMLDRMGFDLSTVNPDEGEEEGEDGDEDGYEEGDETDDETDDEDEGEGDQKIPVKTGKGYWKK